MLKAKIVSFLLLFIKAHGDYWSEREALIQSEEMRMLGSSIRLNPKEAILNRILMGYKFQELEEALTDPGNFLPAQHTFNSRENVERSEVFKLIQRMPKGALLHGHDTALSSQEFIYNLTFKENLHACKVDGKLRLRFLGNSEQDCSCNWTLLSQLRAEDPAYDDWLKRQISLVVDDPFSAYKTANEVWRKFVDIFDIIDPIIYFRPVFEEYLYQVFDELLEDNLMYLEFRGSLPSLYNLDGDEYEPMDVAQLYEDIIRKFKQEHRGFFSARLIYSSQRKTNNITFEAHVKEVKQLKDEHPNLLAGFDLIGQEDNGLPLTSFIEHLQDLSSYGIDFFFHAGETNGYGSAADFNLVDAILLGTKRIGHGYALSKHPLVLKAVKERRIAVEVCPISNQVLMLVKDTRNHPASILLAENYPVVVSSDDPGLWGTRGLSYDFYMAFMGMASKRADLRLLKQLALNSLAHSAMPQQEKEMAVKLWSKEWDDFVESVINNKEKHTR